MAFCRRVQPRLVSVLALQCGRLDLAEDLAQEALARAWERWPMVSKIESPERWVYRVGLNLSSSALRRRMVERRAHQDRRDRGPAAADPNDSIVLGQALKELPARQRAAVVLRFLADFSVTDTAAIMGCASGTVKALTNSGLAQLRRNPLLEVDGAANGSVER